MISRFTRGITSSIKQSESFKQFEKSEEYKKINEIKADIDEFKYNLKEEIDNT